MKQNTFFVNVWTLMLILGLIACGEKKTQVKTELQIGRASCRERV